MEIRKDYILDRWVFFAAKRGKRPFEFKQESSIQESKVCAFCPGNEHLTPPEIGRIEEKGSWRIRWFPNKFAAVDTEKQPKLKKTKFFTSNYAYGHHEVIVETNHHKSQLSDLPVDHIKEVLWIYGERLKELSKDKNVKYVSIFKNHGKEGGTSLIHSHTQLITETAIPTLVQEELDAVKNKKCPYCDIIKAEKKKRIRIAYENKTFIAFAPYASRFNFELWFFPKRHVKNITDLKKNELLDLAEILKKALLKLKTLNASYNFFLHYAPAKKDLHFHIELTPRIGIWGGFELSTNYTINSLLPEEAAKFYRK